MVLHGILLLGAGLVVGFIFMKESVRKRSSDGFTLLELLVAMSILVIIVLMMAGVFHQSRVAWGSGLRKARLNMDGRAVVDFIGHELSQAVADNTLPCQIMNDSDGISFYMLEHADSSKRGIKAVSYTRTAADEIKRRVWIVDYDGAFPNRTVLGAPGGNILARRVKEFKFYTIDGSDYVTNLPAAVDVEVQLEHEEDVSRIRAGSSGPDLSFGTADDIWSDNW